MIRAAPQIRTNMFEGDNAVIVPAQPFECVCVVRFVNGHQIARELLIDGEQMLAPRAVVVHNATAGCIEQCCNLAHAPLSGDIGGSPSILIAAEIRIGAVLQKQLHDLQRPLLLIRQPKERSSPP